MSLDKARITVEQCQHLVSHLMSKLNRVQHCLDGKSSTRLVDTCMSAGSETPLLPDHTDIIQPEDIIIDLRSLDAGGSDNAAGPTPSRPAVRLGKNIGKSKMVRGDCS